MSELSKQALKVENNVEFPNNNAGLITPSKLRTFNEDMIDSTVNQAVYTSDSASWNAQIAAISASAGADTSALNQFTASQDIKNTTLASVTASLQQQLTNIGSQSGSWDNTSLNAFSASQLTKDATLATYTGSNDTKWNTLGGQSGSWITESETGSFARYDVSNPWSADQNFTNITAVSASFTYVKTTYETSSVIYSSGSNQFGDAANDVQTLYGSVRVMNALTASGLNYPTADGLSGQFMITNGTGTLSFDDVHTMLEAVRYGENISIGDPLYVSGSNGNTPVVWKADASNSAKMPVIYIASSTNVANTNTTAITLGLITGVTTTGYPVGTTVYVGEGGGWSANRPSGSNSIVQPLGIVTKEGAGGSGRGLVLNPGPAFLPNIQTGYTWVGNSNNQPTAVATSSFASLTDLTSLNAFTASQETKDTTLGNLTGSFATTGSNNFVGNQKITGSLIISSSAAVDLEITGAIGATGNIVSSGSNGQTTLANIALSITSNSQTSSALYGRNVMTQASGSTRIGMAANPEQGSWIPGLAKPSIFVSSGSINVSYAPIQFERADQYTDGRVTFTKPVVLQQPLTASLTEGYVWAGGAGNITTLVATSSFISTINTGSFATTGSNSFFGTNSFSGAVSFTGSAPTIVSQSFSGSLITNLTDIYTDIAPVKQIVTLTSASYAALVSGGTVDENTLYIVSGSTTGGTTINTGSFATTGSNTFQGTQIITGSVRAFGSGYDIVAGTYDTNYYGVALNLTPDLKIGDVQVGGQDVAAVEMYAAGGNYDTLRISVNSGSQGILFQDFPAGAAYNTWMNVGTSADLSNLGDVTLHRNTNISGNLDIQSTLTASLQQGYVWVGNVNGRTTTVATSSFGGGGAAFPYTGNAVITGSLGISGSMFGGVIALSVATATASVDFSAANMFTLTLPSASTHINPTNIRAGQTVNIQITQPTPGTGSVTFPSNVKFAGGNDYQATATGSAIDMLTLVSYDGTNVLATSIKNFL